MRRGKGGNFVAGERENQGVSSSLEEEFAHSLPFPFFFLGRRGLLGQRKCNGGLAALHSR